MDTPPPQRGLLETVQAITAGEDLRETLSALCRLLEVELGANHGFRASILNLEASSRLTSASAPSLPAAYIDALEGIAIGPDVGSCGAACFYAEPVISEDIARDPKWAELRELALGHGLQACWSQPVFDGAGRVSACLGVYSPRPNAPSDAQLQFLREVATITGLAIDRHRKERENAATVERLNLILEANEDGVWDWHVPSGEVYFSPRWLAMLGYGPGELPGTIASWEQLIHPEDAAAVRCLLHQHLDGRTPYYESEYRCRTKRGGWVWILDRGKVVERERTGAAAVRMVGTHSDITARRDQERQLRRSQARYQAIITAAADAIITLGDDRRIIELNPATAEMFGWAPEDLIGRPLEFLIPSDPGTELAAHVDRYLAGGPTRATGEPDPAHEGQRRDGRRFPVSLSITEWWIDGQRHFTGIVRDISQMVAADTRLRESEAEARKLALVADRTTNAVLITDAHSRIEWINRGFERMTGYTLAEVEGRRPGDVLAGPGTDAQEFDRVRACSNRGEGYETELVSYTKSGKPYWVAIDCQPVHDAQGRIERFIAVQNDITRHRDLERRLLRAERVAKVGNWVLDPETLRLSWSDELFRILERPADLSEPTLDQVLRYYHPEDRGEVDQMLRHTLETGEMLSYRRRLLIGDRVKWIDVRCAGEFDAAGRVTAVFGICQDVTGSMQRERDLLRERRRAEAANRAKSEFLATMSHELRTPLNAIIGYSEMMAAEMLGPLGNERYRGYSRDVLASARYLHGMIENVLNLSRIEAERVEPSIQAVELDGVLTGALTMIKPSADKKGVRLSSADGGQGVRALADPQLLQQVLLACLDNAVKFTPRDGAVWLSVERPGAAVRLQVHDTGIGIEQHDLPKVLEPFYRVHASAETAGSTGTGIGLALADRLVRAMGGQFDIASTPGVGTVVTIGLPAADPRVASLRRQA